VSVRHLDLVDYVAIAEVTGLEVETLMQVAKLNLADSALHAPAAGFGESSSAESGSPRVCGGRPTPPGVLPRANWRRCGYCELR
jgi:hypothetical protein